MSILAGTDAGALTGNSPGWIVTFHEVDGFGAIVEQPAQTLHSDRLEAEISVSLTGDLTPASTTLAFAGLTDADHAELALRSAAGNLHLAAARVHLFWRDTNHSVAGYLTNLAGIGALTAGLGSLAGAPPVATRVAELAITAVSRRRGARRYETVVTGTDRLAAAAGRRLLQPLAVAGLAAAAQELAKRAEDLSIRPWPFVVPPGVTEQVTEPGGRRIRDALIDLAERIELATGLSGRGMLLVRQGTLHVGPRPIPLAGEVDLSYATGLIAVEARAPIEVDGDAEDGRPPRREQWTVQLRGRADLCPGDVVTFEPPDEDKTSPGTAVALFGAFAAPLLGASGAGTTRGYVTGVTHTLSRASGFLTRLSVIRLDRGEGGWDHRDGPPVPRDQLPAPADHPDPRVALRVALDTGVRRRVAALDTADVAEIRAHRAAADGSGAAARSTLWQGTTPVIDGGNGGAARLPIDRAAPLEKKDVPYATPFAWGAYGLVVPRYPGTRVVAVHRNGRGEDPVDVGAMWPDGQGPTNAQPGDWWLSLPANVPPDRRAAIGADADPAPHAGTATNDLVDADGRRVIEVGSLRVRVGAALPAAGARPTPAKDNVVLSVEHSDGTTLLTFTASGDVTLAAKGTLTLSGAKVAITATQTDVEVSAANMAVNVSGQMKVD